MRKLSLLAAVAALATTTSTPASAADGRIGPSLRMTGNGRLLTPAGRLSALGNFPTGGALSPDGRFLWAIDSGHGADDARIVDLASGRVVQTLPLPGAYGGAAFAPDGATAYVSGEPKSDADPPPPGGPTKGDGGDVVHVFRVDPSTGRAAEADPIALPTTSGGTGQTSSLPPVSKGFPEGLAVSPDGRTLVVALNQADRAAIVDLATRTVRLAKVGRYPFGVAIAPDSRTAYVSNELDGTVSVVDLARAAQTATIPAGGNEAHAQALALDAAHRLLYVAEANRDAVAKIDLATDTVRATISVARPEAIGTEPVGLALSPDGAMLLAADEGEDAVAVIATGVPSARRHRVALVPSTRAIVRARPPRLRTTLACGGPSAAARRRAAALRHARTAAARRAARRRFAASAARARARLPRIVACGPARRAGAPRLLGRIPTAAFPTDVKVTPDGRRIAWIAAKGLGSGPNTGFVFDGSKSVNGNVKTPYGEYVPDKLLGFAGVLALPSDRQLETYTRAADRQVVPANHAEPPAGTPLRPDGPIQHVFYVVRENRTYDQVFGSDPRGDGDPRLELFDDNGVAGPTGGVTPNAHALARRFGLLDHFYADSEVSVDGHIITAGAYAIDYVQRALHPNYSGRGRAFDFGFFPVTFPPNGFVFDQAVRQGVPFRDYGELAAGNVPAVSDDGRPTYRAVVAGTDPAYPSNVQIGCLSAPATPANCTRDSSPALSGPVPAIGGASRMDVFAAELRAQDAAGMVPRFNYLILPNDHTNGTTPGDPTPQALIADNDLALGQLVDVISHSSIWASSAIIVVEDDAQDGADHVDAHRMPAFVISPWSRPGAVVTGRYDQYSALRTAEILAGLQPLALNDALATPMYEAFRTDGAPDTAPYSAIVPQQPLTAVNGSAAPAAARSARLPFDQPDLVPEAVLDGILWQSVHGAGARSPAPGPGASPLEHQRATVAERALRRGANVGAALRSLGGGDGDG